MPVSTPSARYAHPIHFSGSAAKLLLAEAGPVQKVLGSLMHMNESVRGISHTAFLQDTMTAWAPRATVSRSLAELTEVTFFEFLESALVYYSVALSGQHVFRHLFHRLAPVGLDKALLSVPLEEVVRRQPQQLAKIFPVKAAIILASVGGAVLAGEYALNFAKNLLTLGVYKKSRFSDVINLTTEENVQVSDQQLANKARKRIFQSLAAAGGLVIAAGLLARFGHRLPKNLLEKFVRRYDFKFDSGRFGLSPAQLYSYMGVAVVSYLDAARDNLERKEVATRLAIVLPYLAFGDKILKRLGAKLIGGKMPELVGQDGSIKSLDTLAEEGFKRFPRSAADEILKKLQPVLRRKQQLFFLPHLVSILGVGMGIGLLNRYWTQKRFLNIKNLAIDKQNPLRFYGGQSSLFKQKMSFMDFQQSVSFQRQRRFGNSSSG